MTAVDHTDERWKHNRVAWLANIFHFDSFPLKAIGEKKEEREAGTTMEVCAKQLEPLAAVLEEKDWENVAIAYEVTMFETATLVGMT